MKLLSNRMLCMVIVCSVLSFSTMVPADLAITSQVSVPGGLAVNGTPVSYSVTVYNNDAADVDSVGVTCAIPQEIAVSDNVTSQGFFDPESGAWSIGTIPSGGTADLVLNALVTANPTDSIVVTMTSIIDNPSVNDPSNAIATSQFPLQRACSTDNYSLLQMSQLGTDGILSLSNIRWHKTNNQSYMTVAIGIDAEISITSILEYGYDVAPTAAIVALLDTALNPLSFDWHITNGTDYIAVGCKNTATALQLYSFDASDSNNVATTLLQTISLASSATSVAWTTINNVSYLAVGCASNSLQLYRFNLEYETPQLSLVQDIALDSSIVGVASLAWYVGADASYLAAGFISSADASNSPLLQLYVAQGADSVQLELASQIDSSVEQETIAAMDWTTDGTGCLAVGVQQPIASPTQPEVVRIYSLIENGVLSELDLVAQVSSFDINGQVHSVDWKNHLLVVSGSLGSYDAYGNFQQQEAVRLCQFSDTPYDACIQIDKVSTIVLNGIMLSAAWQPEIDSCMLAIAGEAQDNGTSGTSAFRFYQLCYVADLSVSQLVDNASPSVNDTVTITLTVQNNSASTLYAVSAQDLLPVGFTFQGAIPSQGLYNAETGIWDIGTLSGAQTATLDLVVSVNSDVSGLTLSNVATVSAPCVVNMDANYQSNLLITIL